MILITTLNKWAYPEGVHFYFNINNLIVPYSFASTAHFAVTFYLSFTIVLGATLLGLYIHKLKFFSLFVPAGCPLTLIPLLVIIEFISYLARNISLGLRLAVKRLSDHKLLNILAGFTYNISTGGIIFFRGFSAQALSS
jgi:F-type H+-transporting ATPase subunit a